MKKVNKQRIVIIGSNGFVGSSFKKISSNIYTVINISRDNVDLVSMNAEKKISKIIKNGDMIFFAAASAPVKNQNMLIDNLIMCNNITKALVKINFKKLVYLSSDAVYSDQMISLNEFSKTDPNSLHGIMHLAREKILKDMFGKKITIVRPTLIYGSSDPHNGYGPNTFIRMAKKNKNIKLFGKGEEKRDHVYIEDVTKIILSIFKQNLNGTFNICSGKLISFYEIAMLVKNNINPKIKIIFSKRKTPMPHNGYRPLSNKKILKYNKQFKFINIKNFLLHKKYYSDIDFYS